MLSKPALLRSESPASSQSLGRSLSASSQFMRSISANADQKDVTGLENEIDILKFELESTKARMESEIAKAREEALSVMKATGWEAPVMFHSHFI